MQVLELWRYPVKSMAGELLQSAEVTENGIAGDRIIQVRNAKGRMVTARTRPLLLRHRSVLGEDGEPIVDGRPWQSSEVAADVEAAAGPGTHLVRNEGPDRFDIMPLLVATDGMIAAVGYDRRRFRPNILVGGVAGLAEREWEGARLRIGPVLIGMYTLRERCVMTTYDPDTGEQDPRVFQRIYREFDGVLGLNSYVVVPGRISVGDAVELARS